VTTRDADRGEERLDLMPRTVRDKLDRVAVKLHLKDWQALDVTERQRLRDLPCESGDEVTHYAAVVEALVLRVTGKPPERLPR